MKTYFLALITLIILLSTREIFAAQASAIVKGTAPDSAVSGRVDFEDSAEGLKIKAQVAHVSPGKHGFHIHENGSCADGAKAACGHFNPDGVSHGLLAKDGFSHAHAGDLGNIEIASDGTGTLSTVIPKLSLAGGKYNVLGKSVILHEKEDDFGQPTGNAGGRIGCGVIQSEA